MYKENLEKKTKADSEYQTAWVKDAEERAKRGEAAAARVETPEVDNQASEYNRAIPQVQDAFAYTKSIYITISNEKYELTREDPKMKGMADLTSVNKDCDYVWEQFKKHEGFEDATYHKLKDASWKDMSKLCREINAEIFENQAHDELTFVFFYYGGHGMIRDGQLEVVTNQTAEKKRNF